MARPRKPPAFLVEATVYRSAKLADLPTDTARLGFFYVVLGQAKLADTPGLFRSKAHFREVAGRFARHLEDYVRVGILEVAPKLCDRCRSRWEGNAGIRVGAMVVHDWHDHQYDARALERGRLWDAEHRAVSDAVSDGHSDGVSDAQSDAVSDPHSDGVSDGFLAGARARDRAAPPGSNVEHRTENGERISSGEDRSSSLPAPAERADVLALRSWGWKRVSKAQLAMLDEIADRHDRPSKGEAWGQYAAGVIVDTPDGRDPLEHLKATDAAWQAERRAEIDAEERRLAEEKAARLADPGIPFSELMARAGLQRPPADDPASVL